MESPHAGASVLQAGTPLHEGASVMIMVHGRNASPHDILGLVPALNRPTFTYLAPAAANHAWYPHSFMADTESNEPWLSSALGVLGELADEVLSRGVPRERLVLLGFSQGACLAGEFAVRNPARYGGIVLYSGGLIGPPGTTWDQEGSFSGTPVFLGCSDVDAHIPSSRVDESARVFQRMEARVTKRIYPGMGHLVNDDEIRTTQLLMDEVLSGAPEA